MFIKTSIDGDNGSGKSGTSARLAVALSVEYHNRAPVVISDSEDRARKSVAAIFAAEQVPLIILPGETIADVQAALERCEREGACVFLADQLTTPWMRGLQEFAYENGNLPFDRRQQLMNQWEEIVHRFRYGQFHAIACGRKGYRWENVEDPESGDLKLVQGDSKFNAGGSANFGYEADLELEIRRRKRRLLGFLRGKVTVEHVCDVIKDALNDATGMNGSQLVFTETGKPYQRGDYLPVLKAFAPHIDYVRSLESPDCESHSTPVVGGKTAWAKEQQYRTELLEELNSLFNHCWGPRSSKMGAYFQNLTLETFGFGWSWSRLESEALIPKLEQIREVMMHVRARIERREAPTDQSSFAMLLQLCTQEVLHPDIPQPSLGDALLGGSLEAAKAVARKKRNGAQPIVSALDHSDPEERAVGD